MKNYKPTYPLLNKRRLYSIHFIILFIVCFTASSYAQSNCGGSADNCSDAQTLILGAACRTGDNLGASTESFLIDVTGCDTGSWAGANPAQTVWYKFTTGSAGYYTVSTDNGTWELETDTRIKILSGTCGTWTKSWCNDDVGDNGCNTLAATMTAYLAANTTYYIMVDADVAGKFCINVFKNVRPVNDCVLNAIDMSNDINAIQDDCQPITSKAYIYNPPSNYADTSFTWDDPRNDYVDIFSQGMADISCNGTSSTHFGVWFKFHTDDIAGQQTWLNVFPNNGCNFYVATLFKGSPFFDSTGCDTPSHPGVNEIKGLEYIDCSTADAQLSNGAARDKACASNFNHPRLDISHLSSGQYWVRVSNFDGSLLSAPPDGVFNLVIEAEQNEAGHNGIAIDGTSNDSCCAATNIGCPNGNSDVTNFFDCLSNAGAHGNAWLGSTCDPVPDGCQPDQLTSDNDGYWNENCFINFGGSFLDPEINNPAIYKFTINDPAGNPTSDLCAQLDKLLDQLAPNLNSQINSQLRDEIMLLCTKSKTSCNLLYSLLGTLTLLPPAGQAILNSIKDIVDNLCGCDPVLCQSRVTLTFNNIRNYGVNGHHIFAFVYRAQDNGLCKIADLTPMGGKANWCDDCLEIGTQTMILPNGDYYVVVDGEAGNIAKYDMRFNVIHSDPLGNPCGSPCCAAREFGNIEHIHVPGIFSLNEIRPIPATDHIEIEFTAPGYDDAVLEVFDMQGKQVYKDNIDMSRGKNTLELNISNLEKGVYMLSIYNGSERIHTKFVKIN